MICGVLDMVRKRYILKIYVNRKTFFSDMSVAVCSKIVIISLQIYDIPLAKKSNNALSTIPTLYTLK